jgi:hypothetical protein
MKAYGGVDIYTHVFLALVLVGGEWWASRLIRFFLVDRATGTHWIGGCVGSSADLNVLENRKSLTLLGLEFSLLERPDHSQSLYRLRYPGYMVPDQI